MIVQMYFNIAWIWFFGWLGKDLYYYLQAQKVTPYKRDPGFVVMHIISRGMMSMLWVVFLFRWLYYDVRGNRIHHMQNQGARIQPDPFDALENYEGKFSNAARERRQKRQSGKDQE